MASVYLDYAAATPLDPSVLESMKPYLGSVFYNPSATYKAARDVQNALNDARTSIAHWLGARPSEIIFTAGGTEANNLTIYGIMSQYSDANVVVSAVEHESVLAPASQYECRIAAVDSKGRLDLQKVLANIDDNTVLVSAMQANNEVGTIQPLKELSAIITDIRRERLRAGNMRPLYLHSDACQAGNYLDLHVARLGVDLLTINGGKLYGPKQSGALYIKGGITLKPLIEGGGQERGLRSGTENVAAAIGLAKALDDAQQQKLSETKRLQQLQSQFIALLEQQLAGVVINGSRKQRLPNNVHITLPGRDNERLLIQLDEAGIMAAAGSACSASNEEPSHVLKAMGLSEQDAQSSLRFTMGRSTKLVDIERTAQVLSSL